MNLINLSICFFALTHLFSCNESQIEKMERINLVKNIDTLTYKTVNFDTTFFFIPFDLNSYEKIHIEYAKFYNNNKYLDDYLNNVIEKIVLDNFYQVSKGKLYSARDLTFKNLKEKIGHIFSYFNERRSQYPNSTQKYSYNLVVLPCGKMNKFYSIKHKEAYFIWGEGVLKDETKFFNFNLFELRPCHNAEIIDTSIKLLQIAEPYFRKQNGFKQNEFYWDKDYFAMIGNNYRKIPQYQFYVPNNLGILKDTFIWKYNRAEIIAFDLGEPEFKIPIKDIMKLIKQ